MLLCEEEFQMDCVMLRWLSIIGPKATAQLKYGPCFLSEAVGVMLHPGSLAVLFNIVLSMTNQCICCKRKFKLKPGLGKT